MNYSYLFSFFFLLICSGSRPVFTLNKSAVGTPVSNICSLSPNAAFSAEILNLNFEVIQKGEVIGQVFAKKNSVGQEVYYSSMTETTTHTIISINIISAYDVHMHNGHLRTSEAEIKVRGKSYAHTFTQYCDNSCEIIKDQGDIINIDELIKYTSTMLLFEEPIQISKSFSELDGSLHPLEALGNHQYKKTDPKGRVNYYTYENSQLKSAKIDAGLIKFEIKRK